MGQIRKNQKPHQIPKPKNRQYFYENRKPDAKKPKNRNLLQQKPEN